MFLISIPASPAFDGHDFAVETLSHSISHPVAAVGEDIIYVRFDHLGDFFYRL
jgi:hypothetical protein